MEDKWFNKTVQETEQNLETNIKTGLTQEQINKKLAKYGLNELQAQKKKSLFVKFLEQFKDFMIIVLIFAAIISGAISIAQGEAITDSIIILVVVIVNSIIGVAQEAKAEKSLEALQKLSGHEAKVIREGNLQTVPAKDLVPGDVVVLETGDYVPADLRIIEAVNLKAQEASLTGESVPVEKQASKIEETEVPIGDRTNMLFSSSLITYGRGKAIVAETGMKTEVGKIAGMLSNQEEKETPLQAKLNNLGKTLGIVAIVICVIIFAAGLIQGKPAVSMFMTAVSLAVAAIPEGLAAVSTIVLAIGVQKMVKKNAIVKHLPAVETLGSSSVICSDKTGTLTQNKMQVTKIANINGETNDKEYIKWLMGMATMCTDVEISKENGKMELTGEPTEKAIVSKALDEGQNKNELYNVMKRVKDIPFDSSRKMMTTIHKMPNGYRVITKGAPDVLLKRCNKVYDNGNVTTLDYSKTKLIENQNNKMADEALRVLAIAYLDIPNLPSRIDTETVEKNLIFIGLIGMIDPPREGVKEAVATCKKAGIKTVMITGDHIITAKAIAKDLGILRGSDLAITGEELDKIPQAVLQRNIMNYSVFARVTPEHKVRIVKAYQSTGAVVAMTGDGVNDAPALKNADIGIAMGKNGTDVAKNAADMVLTDDNFVTIVEAVKQGRNIFDNIKKAVHFLIATNIGEIVTIFLGLVLGLKSPLLAIQLLWINLVTDSLPAIALGLEKPEADIMDKKPRDSKKGIFADGLWQRIITEGTMLGILTLVAFSVGNYLYDIEVGRTMAFVSLGLLELVHSFNIKSEESIFKVGLFENKYLMGAFILGVILQIVVVVIPSVAEVFKLVPLTQVQWMYTFGISILPLVIMEIQKAFNKIEPSTMQIKYSMQNSIAQKNK